MLPTGPDRQSDERLRSDLAFLVGDLHGASIVQLVQIAHALAIPITARINEDGGLVVPRFREEFEARLKVHHATHSKPLDRVSLEDAFRAASMAAGRTVRGAAGATTPFIDEIIDGEGVAIKSTAARGVLVSKAHISKLCEASWIQDVRGSSAREHELKQQIQKFLSQTQRIYQLRVLPHKVDWRYQLIEIPVNLFQPVFSLNRSQFAPDGPRLDLEDANGPCLTIALDRSDAKITVANIPISRCVVHAEWDIAKKPSDL